MSTACTPKKLASQLASIVKNSRMSDAHSVVYGRFVSHWLLQGIAWPYLDNMTQLSADIDRLLQSVNLNHVFVDYIREGKDPCIYFYEEFLRALDPANARRRGVHYSPPSVVSYMVKSANQLLGQHFGRTISDSVVLDPCCGTGAFLKHIEDHYPPGLRDIVGLELMEVPARIAASTLRMSRILNRDGLADAGLNINGMPLVIIGNPPYAGHSSNAGKLKSLLIDYKRDITERNMKWLQDDYVKFIRMAQHRMEVAGRGIVAFITNHSYVFNPTFRAMRKSLMNSFDCIYVLDLNGNAKMKSEDENVFPIQIGVAISFMVKASDESRCRVKYARISGSREEKLQALADMSFEETPWEDITPKRPFALFTPMNHGLTNEFYSFPSLFDLFERSSVGFVTSRDSFAVDLDRDSLLTRIADLRDDSVSPDEIRARYPVGDLDIESARRLLKEDPNWQDKAVEIAYRPFDYRWAYLSRAIMERPRLPFMEHMLQDNLALAVGRAGKVTGSREWDVIFCTDCPTDLNLFRRGGAKLFPKYIHEAGTKVHNLKPSIYNHDKLFSYIYAILHSTIYRERYADFLASDYPRIPIPRNPETLGCLSELGNELILLHLARGVPTTTGPAVMAIGGYTVSAQAAQTLAVRQRIDKVITQDPPWS